MCGRMNVNDDPYLQDLMVMIGLPENTINISQDVAPGAKVSIIHQRHSVRVISDAIWWLLLDNKTLKPNYRYASFNSRYDKLNSSRSLSYKPYRESRCIIPASGFVEGLGDKKTYFQIESVERAIAFGGLYKEWLNEQTGELVYSASIITLPAHPKLQHIHPKSTPLMLPYNDQQLIGMWLDPNFKEVEAFQNILQPTLNVAHRVTPIDRPSKRFATGDSFILEAD
jgi:putative SOS response-associated peptidase YedK